MKKLLLTFTTIALITASCSKDQKVVRQLDGEWEITEMKYDGTSADPSEYENTTYTFEKCKVSKEDCPGEMKTIDPSKGETTFDFTYSISEKGTEITINLDFFGITSSSVGTINEHSKSKFVWTTTDTDGSEIETTIEKK